MTKTYTVLGVFERHEDADKAIQDLRGKGYPEKDISIVMKDMEGKEVEGKVKRRGAGRGATTGAIIGGIAGLVAGVVIPGLGAFFIGGPIAEALGLTGLVATGTAGAVTGIVEGGILGALVGYGVSRKDAQMYEKRINEGAMLVAVPARMDDARNVEKIFSDYHADSIQSVEMPEQEEQYQRQPERYAEPNQPAYVGAKGGKAERKSSSSMGKGWHGDPQGHSKAGKGEDVPGRGKGK